MTTQERNIIYVKMLDLYINTIDTLGLCDLLFTAIDEIYYNKPTTSIKNYNIDTYSELIKHKPDSNTFGLFWFNESNRDIRIDILKEAIEATNS